MSGLASWKTEAVARAKQLLQGPGAVSAQVALEVSSTLKSEGRFDLARRLLGQALADRDAFAKEPGGSEQARKVLQQRALCTYKDPDLPAAAALDEAEQMLWGAGAPDSWDRESFGLMGAIHKRRQQLDGQQVHLERALSFYLRGHELDRRLKGGAGQPGSFEGYAGINAAFLLDVVAAEEEHAVRARGIAVGGASVQRRQQAKDLRQEIANELRKRLDLQKDAANWFLLTTLGQALLGLEDLAGAKDAFARANALEGVPDWEQQTTAYTTALQIRAASSAGSRPELLPRAVLRALVGDNAAAVESALRGKVGLALSGGGFRASLFHIGVLARLAELDELRHVEVISGVSGGAVIAAFYYLRLRKLLEERGDDVGASDYLRLVEDLERDFLGCVQRNLRSRMTARVGPNLVRLFGANGSTLADVLDTELYQVADPSPSPHLMRELRIQPGSRIQPNAGRGAEFHPRRDNWRRKAKVPVLVLNATALNTGHSWQFSASFMGESPNRIDPAVDGNYRLRRMYYEQAEAATTGGGNVRLADAVAASAAVPGLFDPVALDGFFPGKKVRLVDGGVYDNQGIDALLEQGCSVLLVSDASGQGSPEDGPRTGTGAVLKRTNDLLQSRVRIAQHKELVVQKRSGAVRELMFIHLKKDLNVIPIDWANCDDPKEKDVRASRASVTSYGVAKNVQRRLAALRTDLDCFHDVEAFALMASGYRMAERELGAIRKGSVESANPEISMAPPHPWRFLALEPALTQGDEPDAAARAVARLLGAGKSQFTKLFELSVPWPLLRHGLVAALAILVVFAIWSSPSIALPAKAVTAGAAIAAALTWSMLIGGHPSVSRFVAVIAAPLALLDVVLLDRLYLRCGSLARVARLGLGRAPLRRLAPEEHPLASPVAEAPSERTVAPFAVAAVTGSGPGVSPPASTSPSEVRDRPS
ncbi:MAG: patatin-like phospholipase family protein [Myxococcales bacterium]